ncbi:MAG: GFA family protein [Deltaproteobacteria bacterium]|nr:GFA family protein [Deltaproteobacteria bacterium]
MPTYQASCHCGAIRFRFTSDALTTGRRCNCSICVRKGAIWSASYYRAGAVELLTGADAFAVYTFGDRDVHHCFCKTCGIAPFTRIAGLPDDYDGQAQLGDFRINLGCVEGLDHDALDVSMLDGRSL